MRLLLVNKYTYVTAGADRHCLALADALRERSHEVAFLSVDDPRNIATEGEFVASDVSRDRRDSLAPLARVHAAGRALWNRQVAQAMERLIGRFRPDVMHVHKLYPQLSAAPVVVAARHGTPVVQTLHDYESISASWRDERGRRWDRDENRFQYRLLNAATHQVRRRLHLPRVNARVAVSRYVAARHAAFGLTSTVVPNFAQPSATGVRRSYAEREGVAFVGVLGEWKGIRDVVDLARRLPALPVTVAGEGPLAGDVAAAADELPNLTYLGVIDRDEVPSLLGGVRLALMPSRWPEPGPLAALEAMAVGTPVVAYANGGLAEYVADASAGPVVPQGPGALALACQDLYRDSASWEAASAGALAAISSTHSVDTYVSRLETIYEQAAAGASFNEGNVGAWQRQ